jgi:hypothetical protein
MKHYKFFWLGLLVSLLIVGCAKPEYIPTGFPKNHPLSSSSCDSGGDVCGSYVRILKTPEASGHTSDHLEENTTRRQHEVVD